MRKHTAVSIICMILAIALIPVAALGENVQDSLDIGVVSTRTLEIRPLFPQERGIMSLYSVVYESLVTIDDNGLPQPLLAESWTETGDGKTWTFTLRENITFSDGTPLTMFDVAASGNALINRAKDDEAVDKGFYRNITYYISSITAKDERTLEVKAARPYYGVLYAMTYPVVHATQVDTPSPLGTGPYVIEAFEPAGYMWLKANEKWWQSQPQVREIMATFFTNNKEMITAFEYNRVDTVFTRSVAAAQYKSGISSLSVAYSTRQLECLMMNHKEFPLESVNVRKAIHYAINKDLIAQNVYMGMTVDADTPIPSDSWLYYDQEKTFVYNPDKAKELLAADGWEDLDDDGVLDKVVGDGVKHFYLQLYVYEDPENNVRFETANMIKDMLENVGIIVKITNMEYEDELVTLEKGSFELALCAFQMDVVPDIGFFLRKGNKENYCRYVSSDMSSLIETLRKSYTQSDFAYAAQAMQQQFANDVPFMCLFYRSGAILTRKMYTTVRSIRELELLRGIEAFGR